MRGSTTRPLTMRHTYSLLRGLVVVLYMSLFSGCTLLEIHYHAPESGKPEVEITIPEMNDNEVD